MSFLTTNPNRHLITIPSLNGVVNSASGTSAGVSNALNTVFGYINSNTNTASFNTLTSYTSNSIVIKNNLNLSNVSLLFNGSNLLTSNTLNTRGYTSFQLNNEEQMRLTTTGLGIGTSNPVSGLHVASSSRFDAPVEIYNTLYMSDGNDPCAITMNGISVLYPNFLNNSNMTAFAIDSDEKMRLTTTGLGIATTTPRANLHVKGTTIFETGAVRLSTTSFLAFDNVYVLKRNILNNSNYTSFQVNTFEKMRLTPDGFGIQKTTPLAPLHVNGDTIVEGSLYISSFGAPLTSSLGNMYADGDIFANGIMYPSDPKLKDNVRPYTLRGGLPQPVEFTWKSNGQRDIGVMADDVQTIESLCVHTLANGNLSVDYPKLVVLCLAELKELRQIIGELREEIQQLRQ